MVKPGLVNCKTNSTKINYWLAQPSNQPVINLSILVVQGTFF